MTLLCSIGEKSELLLCEAFGPTVQGEGPRCGERAVFVRLADCNLACSWCDTPFSWQWKVFHRPTETYRYETDALVDWICASGVGLVVITGGEPLLQQEGLERLVTTLRQEKIAVEVETNGTRHPSATLLATAQLNVSPKLASAGMTPERRIRPAVLRRLANSHRSVFKFVVADKAELDEVAALVKNHSLTPVWVMPQGRTRDQVLNVQAEIADAVIAYGWNLSTRLHMLLWGDQRGR